MSRRLLTMTVMVAAAFLSGAAAQPSAQTRSPRVNIDSGTIEGVRLGPNPNGAAFLGIPYAAPPVGDLRWKAPQPAQHWPGIRMTRRYGPACMQLPSGWLPEMLGVRAMPTSEDCLYLNVWTPDLTSSAGLPVIVWVHGGGNVEGSGEWPPLGPALSAQGAVMVSLNYRLGAFGFFSYPALSAASTHHVSGNYGHLDQVAALEWVRRNIRQFGGDPRRVTVAGQSSGALDICNLMASPVAAGLFQRAILQSGVCVDSIYPDLHAAESSGAQLAKDLKVQNGPGALKHLRAVPAARVLATAAVDAKVDLEPVVDGWFFREQPARAFAQGRQAAIPVIVGTTEDEVSIFASPLVKGTAYRPKTVAEYRRWLQLEFKSFANAVFAEYPVQSDRDVPRVFRTMYTDFDFGYGAYLLAREMAKIRQNAFLYHFTYVGAGEFASLGAFHSEENMFLSKRYWTSWVGRPYDRKLSDTMIAYWVQFARTGNPNGNGSPVWPTYNSKSNLAQELGTRIGPEPVPRKSRFRVFSKVLASRLQESN